MARAVFLRALFEAARRSKLLPSEAGTRLADAGERAGIATASEARRWLRTGGACTPALAARLIALLPPTQDRCGPWQLLAHLADGGMGSVWLATGALPPDAAGEPGLAVVKRIQASRLRGPPQEQAECAARFAREARLMRHLRHPHIVALLDAGEHAGAAYLALEYVPWGDLRDLLARGPLPEATALALVAQVAQALGAAHAVQVVHRDLKPANILLADRATAKLADFGIARSTDAARTELTRDGTIMGSPHYMAPEQVLGETALDGRVDLYALGAVLWTCLAGATPFQGSLQEVLHQQVVAPMPDVRTVAPHVSLATAALLGRALAKRREDRYPDPAAFAAALRAALASAPTAPPVAAAVRAAAGDGGGGDPWGPTTVTLGPTAPGAVAPVAAEALLAALAPSAGERAAILGGETTATLTAASEPGPLTLRLPGGTLLVLWAERRVVLGAAAGVAVRVTGDAATTARISRQHTALWFEPARGAFLVADLASANGTWLDGVRLPPHTPVLIPAGGAELCVGGRVRYQLAVVPGAGPSPAAVVLGRSPHDDGRRDVLLAAAIGLSDPGSGPLRPAPAAGAPVVLRWQAGWEWRAAGAPGWSRVEAPRTLRCGGLSLEAEPGS